MSIKEEDVSYGVTAFLDILGFGNKVLESKDFDDIREIYKSVKLIQSAFYFEPDDDLTRESHTFTKTTVLAFSDCVVVNIPLESEATDLEGTFDAVMSEITSFAYGQGTCCLNSLFIRGGLDLGWWFQKEATLISQSMVNAYKTEGGVSVPAIAISDRVYEYFSNHSGRSFYSSDYDPIPKAFRAVDISGKKFWYIDYITICLSAVGWQRSLCQREEYRRSSPDEKQDIMNKGYRENIEEWLNTHAAKIKLAHAQAPNQNVKKKFEWLADYHNEIAPNFTLNTACLCIL
ncbi:MAG: hypothetical protein R3261_11800 [Alphaproteobacteria bacterium]|nr:hypothetical protein [Alphaproteobacteria bacterium]